MGNALVKYTDKSCSIEEFVDFNGRLETKKIIDLDLEKVSVRKCIDNFKLEITLKKPFPLHDPLWEVLKGDYLKVRFFFNGF